MKSRYPLLDAIRLASVFCDRNIACYNMHHMYTQASTSIDMCFCLDKFVLRVVFTAKGFFRSGSYSHSIRINTFCIIYVCLIPEGDSDSLWLSRFQRQFQAAIFLIIVLRASSFSINGEVVKVAKGEIVIRAMLHNDQNVSAISDRALRACCAGHRIISFHDLHSKTSRR